jgi:hypothetical protein
MPIHSFEGDWAFPQESIFTAQKVNRSPADDHSVVFIDRTQVSASARYKNQQDKNIDYTLIIQRSTGRFAERYTDEGQQTPFLDQQGRCVVPLPQKSPHY